MRRGLVIGFLALGAAGAGAAALVFVRRETPEQRFERALAALARGETETLSADIAALEVRPGYQSHARLLRGARLLRAGRPDAAMAQFAALIPTGSLRIPALRLRAECLHELGRLTEAERLYRQWAAEEPHVAEPRLRLADLVRARGDMRGAIAELHQAIAAEPDDYRPYRTLGELYSYFESETRAVPMLRRALELDPPPSDRAQVAFRLSELLIRDQDYAAALDVLDQTDGKAPALALRGECLFILGQFEAARDAVRRALLLDPDERRALLFDARLKLESGDGHAALEPLQRLLRSDPHDFEGRYQLGIVYARLGRTGESEREMERSQAARLLLDQISELMFAAVDRPEDAEIRDEIARLCREAGKDELAASWQRAADICRDNARAGGH